MPVSTLEPSTWAKWYSGGQNPISCGPTAVPTACNPARAPWPAMVLHGGNASMQIHSGGVALGSSECLRLNGSCGYVKSPQPRPAEVADGFLEQARSTRNPAGVIAKHSPLGN